MRILSAGIAAFSLATVCPDDANAQKDLSLKAIRGYGWTFDYDEARERARRENKPLMVVFRCVP